MNTNLKQHFYYTKNHEWLCKDDNTKKTEFFFGITAYAQEQLGDIVFIDLFDTNEIFNKGDVIGEIESIKSVSNIYSPVTGNITTINPLISNTPEIVNTDPYNKGWILKFSIKNIKDLNLLLTKIEYNNYLKNL